MNMDAAILLCLLRLNHGRRFYMIDGVFRDMSQISLNELFSFILTVQEVSITLEELTIIINRLIFRRHLTIDDGKLYPRLSYIRTYVEIIQCGDNFEEDTRIVENMMRRFEQQ